MEDEDKILSFEQALAGEVTPPTEEELIEAGHVDADEDIVDDVIVPGTVPAPTEEEDIVPEETEIPEVEVPEEVEAPEVVNDTEIPEGYISLEEFEKFKKDYKAEQADGGSEGDGFYNEQAKWVNDFLKKGGELTPEILSVQSRDYDSIDLNDPQSAKDVLKESYILKGYNEAQAERLLRKNYETLYNFDEDMASEDEIRDFETEALDISIAAKDAISVLKAHKENVTMPANKSPEQVTPNQQTPEELARIDSIRKKYSENAQSFFTDFNSIDVEVSENESMNIELDSESVNEIKELVTSQEKQSSYFKDNYIKQDGSVDFKKFAEDQWKLKNMKKYEAELINQGKAIGRKEIVNDELNPIEPNLGKKTRGNQSDDFTSAHDQMVQFLD